MSVILEKAEKKDYKTLKKLYVSAFPRNERPPFFILRTRAERGLGDFHIIKDGEKFVGFAYVIPYADMAYLYYFAIDGEIRGKGYGSEAISELKKIYEGKRFFLAREMLDENSENYGQRVKRHAFYIKNGFTDLPVKIKEASVTFDVMGIGGAVGKEEYKALMDGFFGKFRLFTDARLIENQ